MAAPAKDFARFPAKSPSENGPTPSSSQNKDLAQVGGGECAGTDAISHVVEGKTADAEALPAQVGVLAEERRDFQAEGLQVDPARVGLHFAEPAPPLLAEFVAQDDAPFALSNGLPFRGHDAWLSAFRGLLVVNGQYRPIVQFHGCGVAKVVVCRAGKLDLAVPCAPAIG